MYRANSKPLRNNSRGFSLIELVMVIAIIGLLSTMLVPALGKVQERARSSACVSNLRSIGVAVSVSVNDNDGTFPAIETDASNPVYPPGMDVLPMLESLEPYGVTAKMLQCPSDIRGKNFFREKGSSYAWRPFADGEPITNVEIQTRRGARSLPLSRIRLVEDWLPYHNGRQNLLYADGRVRGF